MRAGRVFEQFAKGRSTRRGIALAKERLKTSLQGNDALLQRDRFWIGQGDRMPFDRGRHHWSRLALPDQRGVNSSREAAGHRNGTSDHLRRVGQGHCTLSNFPAPNEGAFERATRLVSNRAFILVDRLTVENAVLARRKVVRRIVVSRNLIVVVEQCEAHRSLDCPCNVFRRVGAIEAPLPMPHQRRLLELLRPRGFQKLGSQFTERPGAPGNVLVRCADGPFSEFEVSRELNGGKEVQEGIHGFVVFLFATERPWLPSIQPGALRLRSEHIRREIG